MTRKEAIKKWEDYLNKKKDELLIAETRPLIGKYADGNHRANCIAIYQNLIKLVEQVVNDFKQIDEPKCNHCKDWGQFLEVQYLKQEHKWHKVSEEGLPKEVGLYALEFKDDGSTIRGDYYNKLFTYVPHLKVFRYQNAQDYYDNQTFEFDKNLEIPVIAWQKLEPNNGSSN